MRLHLFLPPALLVLAGCAGSGGDYPSLAIRDVERAQGSFEPVRPDPLDVPEVPVEFSGTLEQRLADLVGQARDAHERFAGAQSRTANLVAQAAGADSGSNRWAAAQVALADLDSIRSETAVALGELDILAVAAAVQAEDRGTIISAREQVTGLIEVEDAALRDLRDRFE